MWILIVRWSWTVADEGGMFGQRSWCIFDETYIDSEGKDVYNRFIRKRGKNGSKECQILKLTRRGESEAI